MAKEDDINHCTLVKPENITLYYFWHFCKADGLYCDSAVITNKDQCVDLDCALCLMLDRYMWKKHRSVFDEHIIYVNNDTHNPYKMGIFKYAGCVREMFELAKYLPPPIR